MEEEGFDDALNVRLSRSLMCFLIFEEHRWKENLSEKELTRQFPRLNFLSKKKERKKFVMPVIYINERKFQA